MDLTFLLTLTTFVQQYGLIGVFVGALLGNATIFFPVPVDGMVLLLSPLYNPWVLALVAAAGAGVGEMTAYLVGFGIFKGLEKMNKNNFALLEDFAKKVDKWGFPFIIFASFSPFLPFDIVGIAAGLIRYDWKLTMVGAAIGKFCRYIVVAYAGLYGSQMLLSFFGIAPLAA